MISQVDAEFFLSLCSSIGHIREDDIAVGCPICNEDSSFGRKHRLHLYIKSNYEKPHIKCFNCDISTTLYGFIKDYFPDRLQSYKKLTKRDSFDKLIRLKDVIRKEKTENNDCMDGIDNILESNNIFNEIDEIDDSKIESSPITIDEIKGFSKEFPLDCKKYIQSRGLDIQENWLYANNKIIFNGEEVFLKDYIIVPLLKDKEWYGFQAIGYKEKKFFVYLVNGNTSWKVENWFNIDKSKDCYIFESVYDRLSSGIDNSIAVLGANLHEDRLKELENPIFCLDNFHVDKKALNETKKYMERGFKCLIWTKAMSKFKDTNDMRKVGIGYDLIKEYILKNIKQGVKEYLKLKLIKT